jgi:sulfite exporter TauE/SafE
MIEWPLIALGGFLGSSHCVGMCGGFALTVGLGSRDVKQNLARQVVYCSGRVFTYAFLGSAAGVAGLWFAKRAGTLVNVQAALSVGAGLLLILQGLLALGVKVQGLSLLRRYFASAPPCLMSSFVGPFLASPKWHHMFVAGILNGLLPCGLVYAYLALASSTASVSLGLATMAVFGAGTVPVMVLTGAGASVVSLTARKRLYRVAGVCVLLTGCTAVARGAAFWSAGESAKCPACEQVETAADTKPLRFSGFAAP